MTGRERMIDLIRGAKKHTKNANSDLERNMIFADYLLEHGVIVPPCKFLSKCYVLPTRNNNLSDITETKCLGFILSQDSYNANLVTEKNKLYQPCFGAFGKTVCLTREEAERALKERENNA